MTPDEFWQLVDAARLAAGASVEARISGLSEILAELSAPELQAFQNQYDLRISESYRWDLWAAAYIINGGCSDDGFRYFRDWLISEGRKVFEDSLRNPDSLANLPHIEFAELEGFGYVAPEIFEEKAASELERDFSTEGAEPAGEPWDEETVDELFPQLNAKYG
jgi:hypothetical protein